MRKYVTRIVIGFSTVRWHVITILAFFIGFIYWDFTMLANSWRVRVQSVPETVGNHTRPTMTNVSSDVAFNAAPGSVSLNVTMQWLQQQVTGRNECRDVAADPRSYWRSQPANGSLRTSEADIARMRLGFKCGMLYQEYFSKPPIPFLYPIEKLHLSEPPLDNIDNISNERFSTITCYNSSLMFKVGEYVAFNIQMKDGRGRAKLKGGDQIRAWFVDDSTNSRMAAKVVDFSNGSYVVSAPLLWAGKLRLHVALAYPREYIRALLYTHRVFKSFCHIAGVFNNSMAREATPCYHTPVVPGYNSSEMCNLTDVNGSPWFCGRPVKIQLNCSDYAGTFVLGSSETYPVTDAETEILKRSCRNLSEHLPCNKFLPQTTWAQDIPTGHMSGNTWYPRFCKITHPDFSTCFQNKQIVIYGDSNGRSHYEHIQKSTKCKDIKAATTKNWHQPLLCVIESKNFSVSWNPHTQPFLHGPTMKPLDNLVPTSKAIDAIPSHGLYVIILSHYYHLTPFHISVYDFLFRSIKDSLVRLFKRNPNVQVVLQGPHIAWKGWRDHYVAGDMLTSVIQDFQQEIFHDIKDKVVFISLWDMTVATENLDYHPSTNKNIFDIICGFMCGR